MCSTIFWDEGVANAGKNIAMQASKHLFFYKFNFLWVFLGSNLKFWFQLGSFDSLEVPVLIALQSRHEPEPHADAVNLEHAL